MEFKFTFEDGSEAIAHYGVKGMKWRKRWRLEKSLTAKDNRMVL